MVRCTTLPPIWYMPASKLTRVRVLAFSKIMASVRSGSAKGWYFSNALNLALMKAARSSKYAYSSALRSENCR